MGRQTDFSVCPGDSVWVCKREGRIKDQWDNPQAGAGGDFEGRRMLLWARNGLRGSMEGFVRGEEGRGSVAL